MRLLLDTHAFLWLDAGDRRLVRPVSDLLQDPANQLFISTAVAWEIAIKYRVGRLELDAEPHLLVPRAVSAYGLQVLPVQLEHALRVSSLPLLHGDPFDRLLIAQAQIEGLTVVTRDPRIHQYDVPVIWD